MRLLVLLPLIVFANSAFAAPAKAAAPPKDTTPKVTLTLSEALKRGLAYSYEVKNAESQVREKEADFAASKSFLLPVVELKAEAGVTQTPVLTSSDLIDIDNEAERYRTYLSATQPLYRGGAISSGLAHERIQLDIAKEQLTLARQNFARDMIRAYLNAANKQVLLAHARDNREILKSYAQVTARYANIGRSKNIDRLSSEALYNLSEAEVLEQESNYERDLLTLYRAFGVMTITETPVLETAIPLQPIDTGSLDKLYEQAVENNPDLRVAEMEIKANEYEIDVRMASHYPSLDLIGDYGYSSPDRSEMFEETTETWSIFLRLNVPLFSGLSSFHHRKHNTEELSQRRRNYDIQKINLQRDLSQSVVNLNKSFQRLKLTQVSSSSSKRAMDVALRDYRTGLISSTDVNQIQGTKYNADKQNTNSQLAYHLEVLSLRRQLGTDLEKVYGSATK